MSCAAGEAAEVILPDEYPLVKSVFRAWLVVSVIAAVALTTLLRSPVFVGVLWVLPLIAFNVYGWFAFAWMRDVMGLMSDYEAATKEVVGDDVVRDEAAKIAVGNR